MKCIGKSFLLAGLLSCVAGCMVNPVTGKRELSLVSTEQELAIGEQQYLPAQQSQGGTYYLDPGLQAYVAEVGQKLAAVSDRPELPYEFVVINSGVPNAWALPGGKIAINRGLLTELEDEAELAAVLGHEVVHAAARHSASQMSRGALVGLTGALATMASASVGLGSVGGAASQLGGAAFMASYGRGDELEADRYGMQYMVKAGYDAQAAVSLQQTFVRLSEGRQADFFSGLFASHPPSQARVDANRKHAAALPGGARHVERYRQKIARLERDAPAYALADQAMAALEDEDAKAALGYLDQAVALLPAESQFWEIRGHAWHMLDQPGKAELAYGTAIAKNPKLFSPLLYRGMTRYGLDRPGEARGDLLTSYELLPTAVTAYYLGDVYRQQGDEEQATVFLERAIRGGNKETAAAAYDRLALMQMADEPGSFIASKTVLGQDGTLKIAMANRTGLELRSVQLQLIKLTDDDRVDSTHTLDARYSLKPRQQIEIRTGLGPFESAEQASRIRVRVLAAVALEPKGSKGAK